MMQPQQIRLNFRKESVLLDVKNFEIVIQEKIRNFAESAGVTFSSAKTIEGRENRGKSKENGKPRKSKGGKADRWGRCEDL